MGSWICFVFIFNPYYLNSLNAVLFGQGDFIIVSSATNVFTSTFNDGFFAQISYHYVNELRFYRGDASSLDH